MIEMTQQKPHISKRCCRICFPIYMPALNLPVLSRRLLALRIKPESAANPCYSITSFLRTFVMSWGSAATRLVHTPLRCHDRYCLQDLQHHVSDHRTVLVFYFMWLLMEGFERFDRWFNCCFLRDTMVDRLKEAPSTCSFFDLVNDLGSVRRVRVR